MQLTTKNHGDWLHVKADRHPCPGWVDWNTLIAWKIPETQRRCLPETDSWMVRRRHKMLVSTLEAIYTTLIDPDPSPAMLERVPKMLECIEKWYPVRKQMQRALQDMLGFKPEEVCSN